MYNRQENVIKNCVLSKDTSNLREEAPDKLTNHTQYSRDALRATVFKIHERSFTKP